MCLEKVFTKKERENVLEKLPEVFTIWKVVHKLTKGKYETDCRGMRLYAGEVKFRQNIIRRYSEQPYTYKGGGHFWLKKEGALAWKSLDDSYERIVPCKVKKSWITNMGTQKGTLCGNNPSYEGVVIVVKRAVFPKYIGDK